MNHSFDIDIAVKYGLHEAILIENLRFWIAKNKANKRHFYDGRYWTYNSAKALAELFPYMSEDQIQKRLKNLENLGVVVTGVYNKNHYDRTKWYALSGEMDSAKYDLPFRQIAESLIDTDINTDTKSATPDGFAEFWSTYPKKTAKPAAIKAWKAAKVKNNLSDLLRDIENRKQSDDWKKNKGQFIPNPATYLNQRRWEDAETVETHNPFAGAI